MQKELYEQVSDSEDRTESVDTDNLDLGHNASQSVNLEIDPEDQGTTDALAAELNSSKEHIKKLEQKLVMSHNKLLQLENHAATGKYISVFLDSYTFPSYASLCI